MPSTWLPEPFAPDPTYAGRTEHTLDWLARSTVGRAVECRRFLNENMQVLPTDWQPVLQHALRERWHSAFFELIVARLLQKLGASISVENTSSSGSKPDFTAWFQDGKVIVEAVSPVINADAAEVVKNRTPLLKIIEEQLPDGFHVSVRELPNLSSTDPKREFKRAVARMMAKALRVEGQTVSDLELVEELPQGAINLRFGSDLPGAPKLLMEPPISYMDDTIDRIKKAVKGKRRQVRGSDAPVLLAIQASGLSSELEDFDATLFGRTVGQVNVQGQEIGRSFKADGLFMNRSDQAPTYAGVLAFLTVGFQHVSEPVLYRHPRFSGMLPEQILRLEQRRFDPDAQMIIVEPTTKPEFLKALGFARK